MTTNPLTERLRPYVDELNAARDAGDQMAISVVSLYHLYVACPRDLGAPALCEAAFNDWLKRREAKK